MNSPPFRHFNLSSVSKGIIKLVEGPVLVSVLLSIGFLFNTHLHKYSNSFVVYIIGYQKMMRLGAALTVRGLMLGYF